MATGAIEGIASSPSPTTIAPSGMLTAKIACQPNVWVSTPPSSAPEDAPSAPIAPHSARPRLRSRPSGRVLVMIERVAGEVIAPAMPCTPRAPMSRPRELASAQISELSANIAVPARNTRRRPRRSAERPPSISRPAKVSV